MEDILNAEVVKKPHSAEYFSDYRDFWWNSDFLQLMSQRLNFNKVHSVLDLGCGVGHWGRVLAPVLPKNVELTGVDREQEWVHKSTEFARMVNLNNFKYQVGDINHLDFPDNSFDLVTCQTVLIHVADVKVALKEMFRVTKPGGLILAAEPNNLISWLLLNSLFIQESVDDIVSMVKFALICERGKTNLGFGCNSIGDLVPGYMAELGLEKIQAYLSDKASPLFAPYTGREQEALIKQTLEWSGKEFWIWDKDETKQYYVAGGGDLSDFEYYWQQALNSGKSVGAAINENAYHAAGGSLMYLIAARKPY